MYDGAHCTILVSYFIFALSHFSTKFLRNFDRCPFDELSFDENSTNGRVRRDVRFNEKSHSTKSHGRCLNIYVHNFCKKVSYLLRQKMNFQKGYVT